MKSRMVRGCCITLAVVALLAPAAASAQEHRGYGGRYSGRASHAGHSGTRSSFGLWFGPGWGSLGWGASLGWGGAWGYSNPYYQPYYRPYYRPFRYAYPYSFPYYSSPYRYYEPPVVVEPPHAS